MKTRKTIHAYDINFVRVEGENITAMLGDGNELCYNKNIRYPEVIKFIIERGKLIQENKEHTIKVYRNNTITHGNTAITSRITINS